MGPKTKLVAMGISLQELKRRCAGIEEIVLGSSLISGAIGAENCLNKSITGSGADRLFFILIVAK
jgi:hypothetical protein